MNLPIILILLAVSFSSTYSLITSSVKISHSPKNLRLNRHFGKPDVAKLPLSMDLSGMIELDGNPTTYAALAALTIIPSFLIVKFIGDSADTSRGSLSDKTKSEFKKRMMQQPTINLSMPSTEEEDLKRQIAKAYMQDKDVDVAVLEEKLKKRAQWRKEMMAQARRESAESVDDEGW